MNFQWPEGATPIDADEAEALIPSLSTQAELNEFEAHNILQAQMWARTSRSIKSKLLSEQVLRQLHREMFRHTWKWAGTYRLTQKSIGCETWQIGTKLHEFLDDIVIWLEHQTYPPAEIAARFHHRLVWIHPFPNGNGRFARLATDLFCEQQGWPVPTWGSANLNAIGDVRKAYIAALQAADKHDFAPLIDQMGQ
ncbi:MAG: mobile mystery protein B [Fimbriimonadaceae bacterium]